MTHTEQATGVSRYDEACRAVSAARTIDEAKDIRDKAEAMRVYAKQAKNRELEADAAEIRFRAERRIGQMIAEQRENGGLAKGGAPVITGSKSDPVIETVPTLADAGVDKHLADRARKYAAVSEPAFEAKLAGWRESCLDEDMRPVVDLLRAGAHVSNNSGENEWYTPPEILEAARRVLGGFDLDPASSEIANRAVKAAQIFTAEDDGLAQEWPIGRIWMNPPYAQPLMGQFADRFADEILHGSTGIVLVNNATETEWFQTIAERAAGICFPNGRIRFVRQNGNPGAPLQGQAIFYCGMDLDVFASVFDRFGLVVSVVRL